MFVAPNLNKGSDFSSSRLLTLDQMVVFDGPIKGEDYHNPDFNQYRLFLEGTGGLSSPYLKNLLDEEGLLVAMALTTKTAYTFDFIGWMEKILEEGEEFHPFLVEQVVTVTHEAIANGIMWSNLELEASVRQMRPLDFTQYLESHLQQSCFSQRYLILSLIMDKPHLEVRLSVEGKPIYWRNEGLDRFRGTAIMRELTDEINFKDDHHTLSLKFNLEREGV